MVFLNMNTCILTESKIPKYSWKKIIQLLWTVVTYLLKNVEHGIKDDVDGSYGVCIY